MCPAMVVEASSEMVGGRVQDEKMARVYAVPGRFILKPSNIFMNNGGTSQSTAKVATVDEDVHSSSA